MVRILTISREFGSRGSDIAHALAARLEWKLIDDPLVAEIAKSANIPAELARRFDEGVDPWFHRLVKGLWRGGYEGSVVRCESQAFDADAMASLWNRVIRESASLGNCVAVGRGGMCLLRDRKDAFHVAIRTSLEERMRNLRNRLPPRADPKAEIIESDARRAAYVQRYFGENWQDYHLYHMVIDSTIGIAPAVDAILCAAGLAKAASEVTAAR